MLTALFVIAVLTLIVAYHFLVERPRQRRQLTRALAGSALGPPAALLERVPRGVFLQPTFTWSEIATHGDMKIGVHPLLLGLIGVPYTVEVLARERVRKGAPLIRISKGNRSLTLRSPVSGQLAEARERHQVAGSDQLASAGGDAWLCRIEPEDVAMEVHGWMIAQAATDWTRRQYARIRDHLLKVDAPAQLGAMAADGGELPVGLLSRLDDSEWRRLEEAVLNRA